MYLGAFDCILGVLDFTLLCAEFCSIHLNIAGFHPGVAVKLLKISLIL